MSDDQAPSSTPGTGLPLIGQVVGERYSVEALLGEGGMGAVYRARHLSLDRPVAIKVLHPRLVEDEQVQRRFEREALAISKLDHPNCVRVMDFGTTPEGMKYLVMPFLEGQELRELTGVGLPVAEVVDLGAQILRALEHAHRRGLVHRDLKPENVFLVRDDDGNRVVKLVDFGIVKLLESEGLAKLTRAGMAFGTPTYMSPEQAAGGKIDERTDLYSLGVVLYELLTGIPPFTADEPAILMRMHILADPPPLPDTVPGPLADVVTKLLGKEPHERYGTAREARRALVAAGAGEVASSTPPSPGESSEPSGMMLPPLDVPASADPATVHDAPVVPAPGPTVAEVPPPQASATALPVRSGGTVMAAPVPAPASVPVPVPVAAPFGAVPMPMPAPYFGHPPSAPTPRRGSGGRGGLVLLFVGLSLAVWAVLLWVWTRDEPTPSAGEMPAAVAAPAPADQADRETQEPTTRETKQQREARAREAKKRLEEQKRMADKWREEQRRAAERRRER